MATSRESSSVCPRRVPNCRKRMHRVSQLLRVLEPARRNAHEKPLILVPRSDRWPKACREVVCSAAKSLVPRDNFGLVAAECTLAPVLETSCAVRRVEQVDGIAVQDQPE